MNKQQNLTFKRRIILFVLGIIMSITVWAQLPTASQIASQMTVGWNLGNTMEAICGESAWGNPATTQTLINAVKAAGFNTVRIPCAWDCHTSNGVIDATWLARVKAIVDYCMNANVYVVLNIHWDNGWLENNVTTSAQSTVNAKQQNYWTQIANYFKGYDQRVLFASANEPNVSDATGMSVLLSYHQTFINAVRATGGNNSSRTLIIQGPSTDIETTNNLMNTMPTDQIASRLMVEVHYYTPYQFCLMTTDATWGNMFYYWGNGYHSTTETSRNATWGEESEVERLFGLMKTKFVDKGIPVILGEFLAMKRTNPSDLALHLASTRYFHKYVVSSAKSKGMIPYYWDTGASDNALFNRSTGAVVDQANITAIMQGAGTSTNVAVASVTLSPATASLLINGTVQLTATISPSNATNKTVSWSSSNTGIARVSSSGLVTGVAAGSATITVTTADGNRTATCAITVTSTSIAATLTKNGSGSSSQTVALGTAITSFYYTWANATSATATGLPSGVTYTLNTSASTITISGTPTVTGTFPYTVSTVGGSPNATVSGTITVTSGSTTTLVYQGENAVINTGVTESKNSGYTGTGYANTDNATGTYVEWTVTTSTAGLFNIFFRYASVGNRPADVSVNGTKVISALAFNTTTLWTTWTNTATQTVTLINGTNKIRTTATTSAGCANIDYLSVTGIGTLKSSLANIQENSGNSNVVSIFPNPVDNILIISLPEINNKISATIYNSKGALVKSVMLENATNNIQFGNNKPGMYILKLIYNDEIITRKFIKK